MDKNEFAAEFKELISLMSQKEIEKAFNELNGCKKVINKRNNKKKVERSRILSTLELNPAHLHFDGNNHKKGSIKALGATLLSNYDFGNYQKNIPPVKNEWWLYERTIAINGYSIWSLRQSDTCAIRPIIVVDEIIGDLKLGESFFINSESFTLISPFIIIKNSCLEDSYTFNEESYECSTLKQCIDGWYAKLIKENKDEKISSAT